MAKKIKSFNESWRISAEVYEKHVPAPVRDYIES
jgi:hypothetical protein